MPFTSKNTLLRIAPTTMVALLFCATTNAGDPRDDVSLADGSASLSLAAIPTAATSSTVADRHPQWVLDVESKVRPGFLTGLPGYEDFVMPVGTFIYFEDPFITTDLRLEYVYHDIPDGSVVDGGQVQVVAAQIRVALTERLAFLATKDGYSWFDTGATPAGDGWNDVAVGLKYALYSNPEAQMLLSGGARWEWSNGSSDVLQGGAQEINPFLSFAKGWNKWHFLAALNGRFPTNRHTGNYSIVWNMHLDYKLTETFRPLIEVSGIHWLSNGTAFPLSVDYLDVGSIGAAGASGRDFFTFGTGFRWQVKENINVGLIWEFPLESADEHLMQNRITFNTVFSF